MFANQLIIKLLIFLISASALLTWFRPILIQAVGERCLKISEVYPNPSEGETEWIELFNCSSDELDLVGWQIFDQLATPSKIADLNNQNLPANSFLVINLPSAKLNNNGDGITIYDQLGQIVKQMNYASSGPGQSWSLLDETEEFVQTPPTPGQTNLTPSPTPTPSPSLPPSPTSTPVPTTQPTNTPLPTQTPILVDMSQLELTEIVACPDDQENEWLELFWAGEEVITFTDWQLLDLQGNVVVLAGQLLPNTYNLLSWPRSILNNSGDQLTLTDQTGQELFSLISPACQAGESYALIDQKFQLTELITKGSQNPSTPSTPSPSSTPTPTFVVTPTSKPSVLGVSQEIEIPPSQPATKPPLSLKLTTLTYPDPEQPASRVISLEQPKISTLPSLAAIIGGSSTVGGGWFLINGKKTKHTADLS